MTLKIGLTIILDIITIIWILISVEDKNDFRTRDNE